MAKSKAQQAAIAIAKKKLKKANNGTTIVPASSPKGKTMVSNLENEKAKIAALVGTRTPDGKVVTTSNAAQVYKLMNKKVGGVTKTKKNGKVTSMAKKSR